MRKYGIAIYRIQEGQTIDDRGGLAGRGLIARNTRIVLAQTSEIAVGFGSIDGLRPERQAGGREYEDQNNFADTETLEQI